MMRRLVGALMLAGLVVVGCGQTSPSMDGGAFSDSAVQDAPSFDAVVLRDAGIVDVDSACATATSAAQRLPADLVFMFDRSSSMNVPTRWPPVSAALEHFFMDSTSTGLNASIQFFCGPGTTTTECNQEQMDWTTPVVEMSPLPQATSFTTAIESQHFCRGTPTKPALQAAIAYANEIRQPGIKVAVVLVTDGEPNECGNNASVVSIASAAASTVPTYVIGVGTALTNLNAIAAAGRTGSAILVDTADATQVTRDFEAALGQISGSAQSCTYTMPAPPQGQALDTATVNVLMTVGGVQTTLPYDATCASRNGWQYDNASNPTQIILCANRCDTIRMNPTASIDVLFGCETLLN